MKQRLNSFLNSNCRSAGEQLGVLKGAYLFTSADSQQPLWDWWKDVMETVKGRKYFLLWKWNILVFETCRCDWGMRQWKIQNISWSSLSFVFLSFVLRRFVHSLLRKPVHCHGRDNILDTETAVCLILSHGFVVIPVYVSVWALSIPVRSLQLQTSTSFSWLFSAAAEMLCGLETQIIIFQIISCFIL